MGLFFEILSSINDPDKQANVAQLSQVTNSVQQLADKHGLDPAVTESVMSMVGGHLRSALQQQSNAIGSGQIEKLVSQFGGGNLLGNVASGLAGNNPMGNLIGQVVGGGNPAMAAVQSFLSPQLQQQIVQGIAQKTGLNVDSIQGMLPTLIPAIFGFLQMGQGGKNSQGGNSILNAFLDNKNDSGMDLGDVLKFSNRFLNPPSQ